MRTCLFSF
uniref:Uncharacterized protein n=1 Tax=Rhizophora mucronata TaxID=61149 RepID=A0A2P2R2F2_RHIMU